MATKKQPCKQLDLEVMTNKDVAEELARIYGDILERLGSALEMGMVDGEEEAIPEALEQGILFYHQVDTLTDWFRYGRGDLRGRDGETHGWGTERYLDEMCERQASEAVAS